MKLMVAFIPLIFYFALWIYTYRLVVKVQNNFLNEFPEDGANYLGSINFFGINTKRGFLFLWDDNFISLSRKDAVVEKLRRRASRCILILIGMIFLIPLSWIIIVMSS